MTPLYSLAHETVAARYFADPAGFIDQARNNPDALIASLITELPSARMAGFPATFEGERGAVLVMPEPAYVGEPYFIAAMGGARPRLYLLECANDDRRDCTALCFRDGVRHVIVGEGPEPWLDDFAIAVDHHARGMWAGH